MTTRKHQYFALDGLRGIAAFIVVVRHTRALTGFDFVPGSYLAVDLFFLLSGFVLAHAYEEKLNEGMSFPAFMKLRLVRLYPLYLMGLAVMLLYLGLRMKSGGPDAPHFGSVLASGLLTAFYLPTPPSLSQAPTQIFPLNNPAWSLFFELIVNIAYGLVAPRLTNRTLVGIIGVSLFSLIFLSFTYGTVDGGPTWSTFWLGLPRVFFGFTLGVWMRRKHVPLPSAGQLRDGALFVGLALVFTSFSLLPYSASIFVITPLLILLFVLPAIVWLGAGIDLTGWRQMIAQRLGEYSYAVYVLHVPLMAWAASILSVVGLKRGHYPYSFAIIYPLALIPVALAAHHWFDGPVRALLRPKRALEPMSEVATQF
jgi:peptidoglycan/LPS O-acetylase OafA/YrhL